MKSKPSFLLINPPIYDFAAHDLWLRPLGLLFIAAVLKRAGADISYIDCMDRQGPLVPPTRSDAYGCGKYYWQEAEKPAVYASIPRIYKRFGLSREAFRQSLGLVPRPEMVLVSSSMTYWYPGVFEAVEDIKQAYPNVPVVLGGTYARLCPEHARRFSGADEVVSSKGLSELKALIKSRLSIEIIAPETFSKFPPALNSLYTNSQYAVIRTSYGCPNNCSYCAQGKLYGNLEQKSPRECFNEITSISQAGIRNIAFYDDALLCNAEAHILPILEMIVKGNERMSFHTPNGLHSRYLSPRVAKLMRAAGFVMPRISLETTDVKRQRQSGAKITNEEFINACKALRGAGYGAGEFMAYLMIGLPGQSMGEIKQAIGFAHENGARVSLSEFSPIPYTAEWDKALVPNLSSEPLMHNNSVYPILNLSNRRMVTSMKLLAKNLNARFQSC